MKKELRIGLDLDGTLTETGARHKAALLQAARSIGVELSSSFADTYYEEKRNGISGEQVLLHHGVLEAKRISRVWIEVVEDEALLVTDSLYPAVLETLDMMADEGYTFYIVTARQHESAVLDQISKLGLSSRVREIFVSNLDPAGKMVQKKHELTKHLGLQAVVGDSEPDHAWADGLGAQFLGLSCGIRNERFWMNRQIVPYENPVSALQSLRTCRLTPH
jgi:phosphoglycolate phosphatase-like HAD superfamily hydrolase